MRSLISTVPFENFALAPLSLWILYKYFCPSFATSCLGVLICSIGDNKDLIQVIQFNISRLHFSYLYWSLIMITDSVSIFSFSFSCSPFSLLHLKVIRVDNNLVLKIFIGFGISIRIRFAVLNKIRFGIIQVSRSLDRTKILFSLITHT